MRWQYIFAILGMILCMFSISMLPPIIVNFIYAEQMFLPFVYTFFISYLCGYLLWSNFDSKHYELRNVEGIIVVVLSWVTLCLISALPFLFGAVELSVVDAIFEAVSGLTTTGTEVLSNLDTMPKAVLYYHQQLEFVGGMGIIVLATSVLPLLGVGGMEIYKAEVGGPVKDSKLMPRIKETSMLLWGLYISLLICCILGYKLGGMSWFDAVCESYGTVSTGGFSIHDNSFAYYNSRFIEFICMIFMLLGGLNFSLHFAVIYRRDLLAYFKNVESKIFLSIIFIVGSFAVLMLYLNANEYGGFERVFAAFFTTISMVTTTGFTIGDFTYWPGCLPVLFMILAIVGGCAGSTSGGIKIIRALLVYREGTSELKRLSHPKAICSLSNEGDNIPMGVIDSIRGFISVFLFLYVFLLLLVMNTGLNFYDSFAAVTSCISNAGASIAGVHHGFAHLPCSTKIILIVTMLAGRLEIMTLIILFTPGFWRD